MIVFKYDANVQDMTECHEVLKSMEIPGEPDNEIIDENGTVVWKGDKFIGIYYADTKTLELYGIKNTNSVQYYKKRYPMLKWDEAIKVKTKRW